MLFSISYNFKSGFLQIHKQKTDVSPVDAVRASFYVKYKRASSYDGLYDFTKTIANSGLYAVITWIYNVHNKIVY